MPVSPFLCLESSHVQVGYFPTVPPGQLLCPCIAFNYPSITLIIEVILLLQLTLRIMARITLRMSHLYMLAEVTLLFDDNGSLGRSTITVLFDQPDVPGLGDSTLDRLLRANVLFWPVHYNGGLFLAWAHLLAKMGCKRCQFIYFCSLTQSSSKSLQLHS